MRIKKILTYLSFVSIALKGSNFDTEPIKFVFKNNSNDTMGIVLNEKLFQIDPKKEVSLFFLRKKMPVTISFVLGPHLNRWAGNLKLMQTQHDIRTQRTYSLNVVPHVEATELDSNNNH